MANWYSGVLKYVQMIRARSLLTSLLRRSTGKRRYGHPALNGVLPMPWLPRAKQQQSATPQDSRPAAEESTQNNANHAVVLTLRKRRSVIKPDSRQATTPAESEGTSSSAPANLDHIPSPTERLATPETTANPWQDTQPRRPTTQLQPPSLQHRLSYDHGSGVIVLPESDDWLLEEDASSDEDPESPTRSVHSSPGVGPERHSSLRKRYSTYYHHPERRRSTAPAPQQGPSSALSQP